MCNFSWQEWTAGSSSLAIAAANGYVDMVKLLLEKSPRVDFAFADGTTVLMKAAENGHLEVVRLLLNAGADASNVNSVRSVHYDSR